MLEGLHPKLGPEVACPTPHPWQQVHPPLPLLLFSPLSRLVSWSPYSPQPGSRRGSHVPSPLSPLQRFFSTWSGARMGHIPVGGFPAPPWFLYTFLKVRMSLLHHREESQKQPSKHTVGVPAGHTGGFWNSPIEVSTLAPSAAT